jgi:hypothetical protein
MRDRCLNPGAYSYKRYGGRGIGICERWNTFLTFLADMGERPAGKTLDRWPDPDGNYEPGNCRWATPKEQAAIKIKPHRTKEPLNRKPARQCGQTWIAPKCPKCGHTWTEPNEKHCLRCQHRWIARVPGRPKNCPNCKQPNWDTPAKRGKP